MDVFVRKLAALSVLWSVCELIMPEGGQRRLVRMTVSALVMITLLSSIAGIFSGVTDAAPAFGTASLDMPDAGGYAAAALRSLANQAEGVAERFASRAGYDAWAAVYIRQDGALDHIELTLDRRDDAVPLIDEREVAERLAELFELDAGSIRLTDGAIYE